MQNIKVASVCSAVVKALRATKKKIVFRRFFMGKFTVGTAKLDITPGLGCHMCGYFNDRLSTDIHDPLYVKALSISDGEREIGLILVDTIYLPQFVLMRSMF